ncbi:MAG: hypothetical protein NTW59_02310 [Candidatus Diapherotrites archaeon]|nr:hypothetical protein [Candidatus Diapherotrites archaeon]
MVRILFVVNAHPGEAFAMMVAQLAAKEFGKEGFRVLRMGREKIPGKPQGNELIWAKINPKDTMLGKILKMPAGQKIDPKKAWAGHLIPVQLAHDTKASITYNWHCSPPAGLDLEHPDTTAFWITPDVFITHKLMRCVEINAIFKAMPPKILAKVMEATPEEAWRRLAIQKYALEQTSVKAMREAGLHPEKFAVAIAAKIRYEIGLHQAGEKLPILTKGTVGEVKTIRIRLPQKRVTRRLLRGEYRRRPR